MKCTYCVTLIEGEPTEKEFCSANCFVNYINGLRLLFPSQSSYGFNEDTEILKSSATAALGKLISGRSLEENMQLCEVLTSAVVHLTALILPQRSRAEIESRIENQKKAANKIKSEISDRDSNKIIGAGKTREQQSVIALGEKLAKDGKCAYCKSESTALFCTELCKQKYKAAEGIVKSLKIDLETAMKMVGEIQ